MSFSSDVKRELCRFESFERDVLCAELYGMLLFGKEFRENQIVFTTESSHAARRIIMLLQNLFMPIIEKQTTLRPKSDESKLYRISLIDSEECRRVFESFGHDRNEVTLRVNRANVSGDEHAAAFVRGVFLSCGSVSDPVKSYHAEFCAPYKNLAADLSNILREITECRFTPKTVLRSGNYVVYFKGSEQICDLLTYIGAPVQAMEIMGTKAVKQVRNNINRSVNGEIANIRKVASAATKQLEAIQKIKRTKGWENLPEDLREIACLRLENPEMSLRDLGEHLSTPISRSGANHRMRRLMEYAGMQEEHHG